MRATRFTLVAAVNNQVTLRQNLLASPALQGSEGVELLIKEGFPSASLAYNSAIDEAQGEVMVFVHQDLYLPAGWFQQVSQAISALDEAGVRWGVLGSFGSTRSAHGGLGRVFTNGRGMHGNPITKPEPVETLDEIVLILRKTSGLRFDPAFPHYHMYGADICLSARRAGLGSFAIPAFCVHNTHQLLELPKEFYECYRFFKRKWSAHLPVAASCMSVTWHDGEFHRKRLAEMLGRLRPGRRSPVHRVDDPRSLLPDEFWRSLSMGSTSPTAAGASRSWEPPSSRAWEHRHPVAESAQTRASMQSSGEDQ